jgi:Lrp/AsnC family leucine-responsive transcriptional regulator
MTGGTPLTSGAELPAQLDATDRAILRELEEDARLPWAELGRRVALTAPAVRDRVLRLQREGVLTGWHASVDAGRLGRPIDAYVRVAAPSQQRQERLVEFALERPEVVECHGLTGEDSYLVRVRVSDMHELDRLTTSLAVFGRTNTSIVLASPVPRRSVAGDIG